MGTGRFVQCKNCGLEWDYYQGVGMNQAYWYCNMCGTCKEQRIDSEMNIPEINGVCSCGGLFIMGDSSCENVICPDCQSKNIDLGNKVLNWD